MKVERPPLRIPSGFIYDVVHTGSHVEDPEWRRVAREAGKRLREAREAGKRIDSNGDLVD